MQVYEFDIQNQEYTHWCKTSSSKFPKKWSKRPGRVTGMTYNPSNPDQLVLYDDQMFCILDKSQVYIYTVITCPLLPYTKSLNLGQLFIISLLFTLSAYSVPTSKKFEGHIVFGLSSHLFIHLSAVHQAI